MAASAFASLFMTALLGLGPMQGARINVLYFPPSQPLNPDDVPPDPCVVDVEFFNAQSVQVESKELMLEPGQSGSLLLTLAQLGGGNTALFYAEGNVKNTCNPADTTCDPTQCTIQASVEVVDSKTGITTVLVTSPLRGFAMPPPAQ
jgi:hypothetical protein